jgi:DNA-binding transcriptional ArsR family regulator
MNPSRKSSQHTHKGNAVPHRSMTPELLALIAGRFRALGEPTRLRLLNELRGGERSVTDLVEATDMTQANVSKHLQVLHAAGLVMRHRDGLFVHYGIADDRVYRLCDIMCDQLSAGSRRLQAILR